MSKERTLVRQILLWLRDRSASWERNPDGPASRFRDQVPAVYRPFEEHELEGLLSNNVKFDSSEKKGYLFLEPINEGPGIVPVMSFRYDFEGRNELWLQLALFVPDGKGVAAIGCRFEPPEGPGIHDYYHAQMFRDFRGGPCLDHCPTWLPTSRPAFQLKAEDPVSLLICMVISLYGCGSTRELQQRRFANELKPYMEKLCPTAHIAETQLAKPSVRRAKKRGRG